MDGVLFSGPAAQVAGMSGMILTAMIQMLVVLFALRWFALPPAGIAFVLTWHALLKGWAMDSLVYAPAFVAAAVTGTVIAARATRHGQLTSAGYRLVGALVPAMGIALYLLTIALAVGPLVWPPHLWVGAVALSGLAGLVVSWAVVPPVLTPRPAV
jgi:hypothetical protein